MVSEPKIIEVNDFADLLFAELVEIGRAGRSARAGDSVAGAVDGPDELVFDGTVEGFSSQFRRVIDMVVAKHGITAIQLRPRQTEMHAIVDRLLPRVRARNLERKIQQMIDIVADGSTLDTRST